DRQHQGGGQRRGSDQRHSRRSVRLAEGQRDDGLRARPRGPRPGADRAGRADGPDHPRERREGRARADLRGPPEKRARRCAVRLLLHEPACRHQHRHRREDQPSTILWVEALDGGDLKNKVPFRDKVVSLAPPFSGQPVEVAKTEWRYGGINYTDTGIALLTENDRASRRTRTWIMEPGAAPRKVWDRKQDAAYDNPGSPIARRDASGGRGGGRGGSGGGAVIQTGDYIYVAGDGASVEGDRPFLDKLNIKTLKTERIFRSSSESLESFVAPLNDEMTKFLTRYETQKEAPNYFPGDARTDARRAVTQFKDPQPQVRDILRQYVTYKRKDGVTLSGTLYLPPGYKQGTRVPVIMWAYPRECGDADSASQVSGSPNQFTTLRGGSHMFLLLSGYAIFDNPTMPIIGPGETANDTYVEQLI